MNIIILLILLASPVFARNQFNPMSQYGNYCGLGYGSINGTKPIDQLDRACQLHDICVSSDSRISCHCSSQLYFNIYNEDLELRINGSEHAIREAEDIAKWVSLAATLCFVWPMPNTYDKYYIGSVNQVGYNYLPMYDLEPGYKYFRSNVNLTIIMATDEQYIEYTWNDYCTYNEPNLIAGATYSGLFNDGNLVFINCNSGPAILYYGNSAFEAYHWPQKN
jgi:hypothetical protein